MAESDSTRPGTSSWTGNFDDLPTDVLLAIITSLTSLADIENVLRASRAASRAYREFQPWIMKKACSNYVDPSNADVAFITLAMLRIHPSEVGRTIDLFSGISDAPWVVAEQLLNRTTLQVEFLRLADHVNHLAEVYARVPNPEWFWRRLALRFNSCWPNQKDLPPRRFTQEQVAVRTEVAAQVWHIMEGVRPAADGSLEPLPEVSHSKEMLQLIQRSFWTREMSVRGSLICGRLQARQEPVPDMGNWFPDEAISGGVNRFLRLLTDVVRHIADVNSGNDLTLIQPYARPNLWDNSWMLGTRHWASMSRWPRHSITTAKIEDVTRSCHEALEQYIDDADGAPWYFHCRNMATLFVRRLADGRMKLPLEDMRDVFFMPVVYNGLVLDVEDWRQLGVGSAE